MKNVRKFNNNVILASDSGRDVIVLGKGLGFHCMPGTEVDTALVEKVFVPQETVQMNRFAGALASLPYEYLLLSSKIIDYAKTRLSLTQSVTIALADHLHFAVQRLAEHLDMQMNMLWDIQHIYPEEFKIGEEALRIIKRELNIDFPRSEAAAIALHLVNAESESGELPNTIRAAALIKKIIGIVEEFFGMALSPESFDSLRFVTHLRNMALRIVNNQKYAAKDDDDLFEILKGKYPGAFACSEAIRSCLKDEWNWDLPKNDHAFLIIHIRRLSESAR
ncbi:MAG: PRD domain-containing protein [Treponema sp.]|jgi:beta-glucoside operon transcriptional antiterminator|nr:PRD domain-containing protein [Treponema sp.]